MAKFAPIRSLQELESKMGMELTPPDGALHPKQHFYASLKPVSLDLRARAQDEFEDWKPARRGPHEQLPQNATLRAGKKQTVQYCGDRVVLEYQSGPAYGFYRFSAEIQHAAGLHLPLLLSEAGVADVVAVSKTRLATSSPSNAICFLLAIGKIGRSNIETLLIIWQSEYGGWLPDAPPRLHVTPCLRLPRDCPRIRRLSVLIDVSNYLPWKHEAIGRDVGIAALRDMGASIVAGVGGRFVDVRDVPAEPDAWRAWRKLEKKISLLPRGGELEELYAKEDENRPGFLAIFVAGSSSGSESEDRADRQPVVRTRDLALE
ncbi:hypothetical protein OQA88_9633 [Cercophora sp. LCS_1]